MREDAFSSFKWLKASGLLAELVAKKWLVPTDISIEPAIQDLAPGVLEHQPIDFISYPYEWPFELLKRAALFHLDLHLLALESCFTLTDASAYNVQFVGTKPIFIDPTVAGVIRRGPDVVRPAAIQRTVSQSAAADVAAEDSIQCLVSGLG